MCKKNLILLLISFAALSAGAPSLGMKIIRNIVGKPIFKAIEDGNLGKVKMLAKIGDVNKIINEKGETPLLVACKKNNLDIVAFLLTICEREIINKSSEDGIFPLICSFENMPIMKLLIENGADVNKVVESGAKKGWTILHIICNFKQEFAQQVKFLLEHGAKEFVNKGVEYQIFKGKTPLHFACERGYLEIVKDLLIAGADVYKTFSGLDFEKDWTALNCACYGKNIEVIELLLDGEAKKLVNNCKFKLPLDTAIRYSGIKVVELLLPYCEKKIINMVCSEGKTFLMLACADANIKLVKLLLEYGADVCNKKSCYRSRVTEYLDLAKNFDKEKNKKQFLDNVQDSGDHDLLLRRALALDRTNTGDTADMLDTMKEQLAGVNVGGANNYKKLQDCIVRTVS